MTDLIKIKTVSFWHSSWHKSIAIAAGFLLINVGTLPLKAQTGSSTDASGSADLENIEADQDVWNFTSESESKSLENNLESIGQYSVDEPDSRDANVEKSWGNHGDVKEYSIEAPVYDY